MLAAGELVALPTETVYGLAGDATNGASVRAIYATKHRPPENPLIVHVHSVSSARAIAEFDHRADALAAAFWPGPLTLVLNRSPACSVVTEVSAGLPTIAIRIPDHDVTLSILAALDRPVAAPSANPSGRVSPTTAQHVATHLDDGVAAIVDGGACRLGLESSVVGLFHNDAVLFRPGAATAERIEAIIGPLAPPIDVRQDQPMSSPGQLTRHYAPSRPVRLDATEVSADEGLLAFGRPVPKGAAVSRNLSATGDLGEAGANLFAMLQELDQADVRAIAVMPIPQSGLGAAINDRLRRAASTDAPQLVGDR